MQTSAIQRPIADDGRGCQRGTLTTAAPCPARFKGRRLSGWGAALIPGLHRAAWVLGALAAGVAFAGCGRPSLVPCRSDGDCEPDHQCAASGECVTRSACGGDLECGPGYRCVDFACVDEAACRDDFDCDPGRRCVHYAPGDPLGLCVKLDTCAPVCGAGFYCARDLTCVPVGTCGSDRDCPDGARCEFGLCRDDACHDDAACELGFRCVAGSCSSTQCTWDDDCLAGEKCLDGTCGDHIACESDESCEFGEICQNGACVRTQCEHDEDCGDSACCTQASCSPCEGSP